MTQSPAKGDRAWSAIFFTGLLLGVLLRLQLAQFARTPGHGDSAFYYTVATNLVDGRGLVVDYVVYFFNGLVPLTHYSADFWHPLASILLSLPMAWLGKSVFSALLASIAAGLVPALVAYAAGRHFSLSAGGAALAGLLTFFAPYQIWVSVTTEANIFFGAFGALALYLSMRGLEKGPYFLLAGMCSGLAHLTRQDGILVLLAIEAAILLVLRQPARMRIALGVGALAIHLLVLSPLMIRNYSVFHRVFPNGPSSTMFLTSYEDFHAYGKPLTWESYRAALGLRRIFQEKLHTAGENLLALIDFLDPILAALTAAGLTLLVLPRLQTERLRLLAPSLVFAGTEYVFYTLIASFSGPGSLPKSLGITIPFFCLIIVAMFESTIRQPALRSIALLGLIVYCGARGYQLNHRYNAFYNRMYSDYEAVAGIIRLDAGRQGYPAGGIVVMTRDPWDVYEGSGYKTVMIPNNDLETIYEVARHYQAHYILLPAPRKALQAIYNRRDDDPRFVYLAQTGDSAISLFRIEFSP